MLINQRQVVWLSSEGKLYWRVSDDKLVEPKYCLYRLILEIGEIVDLKSDETVGVGPADDWVVGSVALEAKIVLVIVSAENEEGRVNLKGENSLVRVNIFMSWYETYAESADILAWRGESTWIVKTPVKILDFAGRRTAVSVSEVTVIAFFIDNDTVSTDRSAYSLLEDVSLTADAGLGLRLKFEISKQIASRTEDSIVYFCCGYTADHDCTVLPNQMPSMALAHSTNRILLEVIHIASNTSRLYFTWLTAAVPEPPRDTPLRPNIR